MNWQEKFAAINALSPASLIMREPGNWYVEQTGVYAKQREGDGILVGRFGNGSAPESAVCNHWFRLTEEQPLAYVAVSVRGDANAYRHVRWNGFMWQELPR